MSVKENQKNLKENLESSFDYFNKKSYSSKHKEKSCIILKKYEILLINDNTLGADYNHDWKKLLKTAVKVTRKNLTNKTQEIQFYVSNKTITAKKACFLIENHWHIENALHKNLDCALKEDFDRSKINPMMKSLFKKLSLNILHKNKTKNFIGTIYENSLKLENILNLKGLF